MVIEIVSVVVSVAALVVAGIAARFAGRSSAEAKRANDRLDRIDEAERERNRYVWRAYPTSTDGRGWILVNDGTDTAEDVQVWSSALLFTSGPIRSDPNDPRRHQLFAASLMPGQPIRFTGESNAVVGEGYELMVVWRGHEDTVAVPLKPAV